MIHILFCLLFDLSLIDCMRHAIDNNGTASNERVKLKPAD